MDLSFGSTAHGAGRTMSRGAAKRKYNEQSVKNALESTLMWSCIMRAQLTICIREGDFYMSCNTAEQSHTLPNRFCTGC
jgi:hypothetical protein